MRSIHWLAGEDTLASSRLPKTPSGVALLAVGICCCALAAALTLVACGLDPAASSRALGSDTRSPELETGAENRVPVIHSVALVPTEPRPGETVRARAEVSDPDGDKVALVYTWYLNGRPQNNRSSSLLAKDVRKGQRIELEVVARDGLGESSPSRAGVRVGNRPPTVIEVAIEPSSGITRANDVIATPHSRDPDHDALSHHYRWRINGREVVAEGGSLPSDAFRRRDRIELSVVASDGEDESEPFHVAPIEVLNAAPRIVSLPAGIDEDGVFTYRILAEDPDGEGRLRYELLDGPPGMNLDVSNGELRWRPTTSQAGTHDVIVQVRDTRGAKSMQSFQLQVALSGGAAAAAAP